MFRILPFAVAALLFAACSKTPSRPTAEEARAALAEKFPAFVRLTSVELDPAGGEGRYNFKATAVTQEALYVPAPDPAFPINLLRQAQKAGESVSAYGRLSAQRLVDKWHFEDVEVTSGLRELGKPKGEFSDAFVVGTPEAEKRIADLRAAAEQARKAAAAAEEKRKSEEAAYLAKQAAEIQAKKEIWNEMLKNGGRFTGFLTPKSGNGKLQLEMRIVELKGFALTVELRNPELSEERSVWKGEVVYPSAESEGSITLREVSGFDSPTPSFHRIDAKGSLKLTVTNAGFVGEGTYINAYNLQTIFSIRLQPAQ